MNNIVKTAAESNMTHFQSTAHTTLQPVGLRAPLPTALQLSYLRC
jgi:hypothetical protein